MINNNNKGRQNDRIGELKNQVLNLPIDDVIQVMLDRKPDRKNMINNPAERGFLCPFHDDHTANGKFTYVDKNGIGHFKCFVCDARGTTIDFVGRLNGTHFVESILDTAVTFDLISKDEYKTLAKKEFKEKQQKLERIQVERPVLAELQPEKTVGIVYHVLSHWGELVNKPSLSEEDRNYLYGRNIQDKEIELYGYFTMPNEAILPDLISHLESKYGLGQDCLIGVPGFYREKATGTIKMVNMDGIGIPMRNLTGFIGAIQVRSREKVVKGSRYKYLSSSFTTKEKFKGIYDGGSKPDSTLDLVRPGVQDCDFSHICITEGHFKAAQFALNNRALAISVQGVNNTKGIIPMLDALDAQYHLKKPTKDMVRQNSTKIILAFDMDMYENVYVFAAAVKLRTALEKAGWDVFYAKWNPSYKGMDDFFIAKRDGKVHSSMSVIKARKFEETTFLTTLRMQMHSHHDDIKDISISSGKLKITYKNSKSELDVSSELYAGLLKQASAGNRL